MTCLNALEVNIWKSNQRVVTGEKINQKVVTDEKSWKTLQSDQKIVMNEQIDSKVVQPSNQTLLEEFIVENEPWLLIGIPSRDPFFVTQHLERHL